jgi:predicted FMN-binding regulatory protein PaiB
LQLTRRRVVRVAYAAELILKELRSDGSLDARCSQSPDTTEAGLIYYDYYADVPPEKVDAFVGEREMGRLLTVSPAGLAHIGLYPFVYEAGTIELHLNRADEQIVDLGAQPRCVFEVDEILGVIPSYWVHPEDAVMATAYHRTVVFECEATLSEDAAELAEQQKRLLARYQPEGGFRPITPHESLYRGAIAQIAAVRLDIRSRRVKFKLAQNRSPEVRTNIVEELRRRGRPNDGRAADALQWTIDREAGR